MTGDDHANNGTAGRFDYFNSQQRAGLQRGATGSASAARRTSTRNTPITPAQAAALRRAGIRNRRARDDRLRRLHARTSLAERATRTTLGSSSSHRVFPSAAGAATNRTHCIVWSDYATQPQVALANGIRLDTNYYYWPAALGERRAGFFTGSGMPMRFAKAGRHDDRRLPGRDADDRRVGPDAIRSPSTRCSIARSAPKATTAPSSPTCTPTCGSPGSAGHRGVGAGATRSGDFGEAAARLGGWTKRRHLHRARLDRQHLDVHRRRRRSRHGLQMLVPAAQGSRIVTSVLRNGVPVAFSIQQLKGVSVRGVRFSARCLQCDVCSRHHRACNHSCGGNA